MSQEPEVHVVDDDAAVLDSLGALLEAEGFAVQTYASARAFLDAFQPSGPCCVISDVRMPGMDGLELLAKLGEQGGIPPVILITGHGDIPMAVQAMKLGARDFIEKPWQSDQLLRAIRETLAVCAPYAPGDVWARLQDLTAREREVLDKLVLGRSNKGIARELGISPRTVEIHRARVMEKMQATSLAQLVRMAVLSGVDPEARPNAR
jgi:two-component system response regulator FixJ